MKKKYITPSAITHKITLSNICIAPTSPGSASDMGDAIDNGIVNADAKDILQDWDFEW